MKKPKILLAAGIFYQQIGVSVIDVKGISGHPNQGEFEKKVEYLLNPENYKDAVRKIRELPMNQSWEDVTSFHLDLIKQTCKK